MVLVVKGPIAALIAVILVSAGCSQEPSKAERAGQRCGYWGYVADFSESETMDLCTNESTGYYVKGFEGTLGCYDQGFRSDAELSECFQGARAGWQDAYERGV